MKLAVRRLVLAAVPALALGVAGCSIHEQTQTWYSAGEGVNAEAGDIGLRNVLVVADDDRATVVGSLSNRGAADELLEIVIGDVTVDTGNGLKIPAGGSAKLGPGGEQLDIEGADTVPGYMVDVEFRFANAPRTTVHTLVRAAEDVYADALPDVPVPLPTVVPGSTETPGSTSTGN